MVGRVREGQIQDELLGAEDKGGVASSMAHRCYGSSSREAGGETGI